MAVAFIMALPQCIVIVQFVVIFILEGKKLTSDLLPLPILLAYAVVVVHLLLCIGHVILLWMNMLKDSKSFTDWMGYGANTSRFRTIFFFSLFSKQAFYLLFSGLFRLPMTTLHFKTPPRTFYITHLLYMAF